MLSEVRIKNLAIIDSMELQFSPQFNVISGETGSGKSLILKALYLLMGAKSDTQTILKGAKQATVEGVFDLGSRKDLKSLLEEQGFEVEDLSMIIRRVISREGKSKVFINDRRCTLSLLKSIVDPLLEFSLKTPLIEVTGQHDNKYLQSPSYHLDLLDSYSGTGTERQKLQSCYKKIKDEKKLLEKLENDQNNLLHKLDFLEFQKKELEDLNLQENEIENLEEKIKQQRLWLKNREALRQCTALLSESEYSALQLFSHLKKYFRLIQMEEKKPLEKKLEHLSIELEELCYDMSALESEMSHSETPLNTLEERLHQVRRIQKKYGATYEEIQNSKNKIDQEIHLIKNFEVEKEKIEKKIDQQEQFFLQLSLEVHQIRKSKSLALIKKVNKELKSLNMKGVAFHIDIQKEGEFTPLGISRVRFMINSGEGSLPLDKFASGGELSRILLALKKVLGNAQCPRTFLFDEIDTGVSGETAQKVGHKLFEIAKTQQVICITHLPQVASYAQSHYVVDKENKGKVIRSFAKKLTKSEQVQEIARLISGSKISSSSIKHAKQLVDAVG